MFSFRDQSESKQESVSKKVYLDVPYDEKNEAKALGAKWDKDEKKWYSTEENHALISKWGMEARIITHLDNEDRAFGGQELNIEWTPKSCWCKKIEYAVQKCDRTRLCNYVFGRVNRKCETCGVQDAHLEYKVHGRWSYDQQSKTQTLVRLMALCEHCFEATHFGSAHYNGRKQQVTAHLQSVRDCTKHKIETYIQDAFESMKDINQHTWTIDLSLLTENGIKCEDGKKANTFFQSIKSKSNNQTNKKSNKQHKKESSNVSTVQHRAQSSLYTFRDA